MFQKISFLIHKRDMIIQKKMVLTTLSYNNIKQFHLPPFVPFRFVALYTRFKLFVIVFGRFLSRVHCSSICISSYLPQKKINSQKDALRFCLVVFRVNNFVFEFSFSSDLNFELEHPNTEVVICCCFMIL